MIDFENATFFKLSRMPDDSPEIMEMIGELLIDEEAVFAAFKGMRDMAVFTNRRIISVNVQGLTGKKRDYTSLPYSKIVAFSFESAGRFDLDAEMDLWFSGLGKVRFEFKEKGFDVKTFSRFIGGYVL